METSSSTVKAPSGFRIISGGNQSVTPPKGFKIISDPSLSEKAASVVKRAIPIPSSPNIPLTQFKQGSEAMKVPFEEAFPIAGMIAGGANPLLAGAGGATGEAYRQIISRMRGGNVPETPTDAGKEIGKQALAGAGGAIIGNVVSKYALGPIARFGARQIADRAARYAGTEDLLPTGAIQKAVDYLKDYGTPEQRGVKNLLEAFRYKVKPNPNFDREGILGKVGGAPVVPERKTANLIQKKLENVYLAPESKVGIDPDKLKDLMGRGMSEADATLLLQRIPSAEQSLRKISSGESGKLTSQLQTAKEDMGDYRLAGRMLEDLQRPDITYGEILQMQKTAGEFANFQPKGNATRSPVEKVYGKIYNSLRENELAKTAEAGKFSSLHNQLAIEGAKTHQTRALNNIIEDSTDPKGAIDFGKLYSHFNMSEDKLTKKFGDNRQFAKALEAMAFDFMKRYGGTEVVRTGVNFSGTPYATLHTGKVLGQLGGRGEADRVAAKYLDPTQKAELLKKMFPTNPILSGTSRTSTQKTLSDLVSEKRNKR